MLVNSLKSKPNHFFDKFELGHIINRLFSLYLKRMNRNEYHIYIAPFSCETSSKALHSKCSHKGVDASSTSAGTA